MNLISVEIVLIKFDNVPLNKLAGFFLPEKSMENLFFQRGRETSYRLHVKEMTSHR